MTDPRLYPLEYSRNAPLRSRLTTFALLLPAILSLLVLAAHFFRAGQMIGVAITLAAIVGLFIPRKWTMRAVQLLLIVGTLEWLRSMYMLVGIRAANEMPWTRLAIILSGVAGFTALSALLFESERLQRRYGRNVA